MKRRHIRKAKQAFLKIAIYTVLSALFAVFAYNIQIIPVLSPLVKAQVTTELTKQMNETVRECLSENTSENSEYVRLKYGNDGTVVSLETNTSAITCLISDITVRSAKKLCNDRTNVKIPLGNLTGGAVFTGKGPNINASISVSNKITCDIKNEFYESGINQTIHRVFANVTAEVYAMIPLSSQKFTVTSSYCIAETIIIGKVPDAYTKINRLSDDISETEIDDIYDFGATVNG